ncbi:UPF0223 family protein [Leuconostoc falkenbergense]|uniref:UPF0223 family protein n=1 Tax=Leuconostoc falkenbergense TaxID=2766470 RepID=UPI0024A8E31D|nr:UPF0223 family protein [Leuconostoc falkenbergense]MDI6552837.1 UPF0223 family protein [Leuconostoc falkenbergense]
MSENYTLPIDGNWTTEDIVIVSNFVDTILKAYENGVSRDELVQRYKDYRAVMPSKSEQKRFDKDFERQTGHSIYQVTKLLQTSTEKRVRL